MSTSATSSFPDVGHPPARIPPNHHRYAPGESTTPTGDLETRTVIEEVETIDEAGTPADRKIPAPPAPKKSPLRRRLLLGLALAVTGVGADAYYQTYVAPYESTDDAYIATNVTPVAPQVAGRVARLEVTDNQPVERGQLLLQIDPRDYQAKLDQARAGLTAAKSRLEQARAQLAVDQAKETAARANVAAASAEAAHASADSRRFQAVGDLGVSASQLDLAATRARSAAADLDAARSQVLAAQAQESFDQANIQTAAAAITGDEASVRQAELDLSYTRVTAPVTGLVTHRTVEAGAYVQTGQALLAIVPRQVWVVANFKETQLAHMHRGQPVALTVDAYPQLKLQGRVDSIQAGSGASFSLLPPENASGNFVKVVQRVPVKIVLDRLPGAPYVLGPGMSVEPEVRIR